MVDGLGGGRPGAPGPAKSPGGGVPRGLGVLVMMMQAGLQEYDWAIGGIVERAKSTLAAGAIVISVLIAGIGGFAWMLNSGDAPGVMEHLRATHAIVPITLLGSAGFVAMVWSAHFSVAALSIVEVKSPFSTDLIMANGAMKEGLMHVWESASEAAAYRGVCKSYAVALENREKTIKDIGPKALLGQRLLLAGLGLTASATIVTIVSVGTAVGA